MPDTLTQEQRRRCMSHIRSKNTKPEILIRHELFCRGYRYRINVSKLPGKPDIVLPKYKTVIFINGCFWHGHEGCKHFVLPKSNVEYWKSKIFRNQQRDKETILKLQQLGWKVVIIWECEINKSQLLQTINQIVSIIGSVP
ncbi:very short patch repair endonuclease [Alistipes finegoldii]|uniref:very short patch repair endonuclease n=1 Tax=Alistipes finegoldii TaxID=214856 RepID=UPI00321ADADB